LMMIIVCLCVQQQMLAPLLSLMHSLVLRAVPPLASASVSDPLQPHTHSPLRRQSLFPFPMRPVHPIAAPEAGSDDRREQCASAAQATSALNAPPSTSKEAGDSLGAGVSGIEAVASEGAAQQEEAEAEAAALAHDEEEDEQQNSVSRGIEMVRNILDRCCYFLTVPDVSAQVFCLFHGRFDVF
jgi:hypothetical protein